MANNDSQKRKRAANEAKAFRASKGLNANKLLDKTVDNMAMAEALTEEHPLWTEKTAELERREQEDEDNKASENRE